MIDSEPVWDLVHDDSLRWLRGAAPNQYHAVVTDPPYGLVEYHPAELEKRKNGKGIWRLPHAFDGYKRRALPRFTVLTHVDHERLKSFFAELAASLFPVLVPGAHVFVATNSLVSHWVSLGFIDNGFEKRGEIVRLVQTLRGGDRPKNAHNEFPEVSVLPRGAWEPWLLFRKPPEGRIQDNLRKWTTGGLRRLPNELPFKDVIRSSVTPAVERDIADHPSLKPQRFMRQLVRAALPLGQGHLLDPFAGSGSTLAAATALRIRSTGIERDADYVRIARQAIPQLAAIEIPDLDEAKSTARTSSTART